MDSNSNEKKPKRPRIGQTFRASEEGSDAAQRYERPSYNAPRSEQADSNNDEYPQKRTWQPRQQDSYGNDRPYNQNGYNRNNYGQRPYNNSQQRPYNQRPYQPRTQRPDFDNAQNNDADGEQKPYAQRPYQPRQYNNYHNGNNYNNGGQQRPYNNGQHRQNNYNNGGQQRPYNNNGPRQYNNGGQQRPYNNNGQHRQNSYNNGAQRNNFKQRNNRQGDAFPRPGKSFTPRPKRVEYDLPAPAPDEQIRLNKYMSNAGICSRREADEFIQQGLVKVNGKVVTELGTKITHSDVVEYDEKVVTLESKCYILLNKPKDCVTTSDDPNGRTTVMDLVKGACTERIYPVGRLDRNTTGVLLLTNDGDLASKLTHPKFVKKKIYHVWCDRDISEDDMQRIADGIELEDGPIHADAISYATETDRNQAGIEIHSGRNRIVRRIFESLGYHVVKLDRVYFAGLTKKNLPRGRWRYLTQEEVNYLKMGSFE